MQDGFFFPFMKLYLHNSVDNFKRRKNMSTYKQLTRSTSSRMLAGVCGGLGEFLDIDPTLLRLAFALGFFVTGGSVLLVYIVMAIVVPPEPLNA
jgi:phage shock protein C